MRLLFNWINVPYSSFLCYHILFLWFEDLSAMSESFQDLVYGLFLEDFFFRSIAFIFREALKKIGSFLEIFPE